MTSAAANEGVSPHRCAWAQHDPLLRAYHDAEWGVPERDSRALWEKLMLDGFQAGLSWLTILRKRDAFRRAFQGFDPAAVARFDEDDIVRLLQDPGIVTLARQDRGHDRQRPRLSGDGRSGRRFRDIRLGHGGRHADPVRGRRDPREDPALGGAVGGVEAARLHVRRPGHRLRLDAGDGDRR